MNAIIKKIHIYLGLLSFSILLVFGIVGVWAALRPPPPQRPPAVFSDREITYTAPANLTDKQIADHVWQTLNPPLTAAAPEFAIRRDRDHNLNFLFYSPNGLWRVSVREKENRVLVSQSRNRFAQYLNALHETHSGSRAPDWRIRLWTYYNEFSIWTLSFMALSGVYLWLSSRPRYRWGQVSFAAGAGSFLLLYLLVR